MRLTHLAQMRLPFGRLVGYRPAVSGLGRDLPVSFDQRRHVEAGDRPGSWMALSLTLPGRAARADVERAWLAVVGRHGTLRSVFTEHDDGARLRAVDVAPGEWVEHEIASGEAVSDAVRGVFDAQCRPYAAPSHYLCLLETAASTTVLIGTDHAHVDMWSLVVIGRDFVAAHAEAARTPSDAAVHLATAPPFAEHTAALRERGSASERIHARWREILDAGGSVMPVFPLELDAPAPRPERVEVREVLDVAANEALAAAAAREGVSALALAVSVMTRVTARIAERPLRAVFPVHSRYDHTWHESVGWFITNSVLESADASPRACAAAVKEAVQLGSHPLEDVLTPWGGMPQAPGMFAISWLDLRRLPVSFASHHYDAHYVGAPVTTDGVMLWFISDQTGLHLRCRYPDTLLAREHVGGWLDAVVEGLVEAASRE
ncbi:condensation domain-containing protein [Zhihengliuella flava]|uniref:Condensation domain-containing protein n=1 Tax=Zhihengliuella flava TaxID=1285193 RepID=A0A931GJN2_9MICC|nr:condensation domain-containing protein [Zhihengliuella flava]MBG6085521.1 hypothetical protein [Zhihengliuella flava]